MSRAPTPEGGARALQGHGRMDADQQQRWPRGLDGEDSTPLKPGHTTARSALLKSLGTETRERRALAQDEQARPYMIPSLIPQALKDRRAWLFWHAEADSDNRKAPHAYNARSKSFYPIDNRDPRHWMPYEDAVELARAHGMGLGTVLNGDGVIVMDIDAGLPPGLRLRNPEADTELLRASWDTQMLEVAMYLGTFAERSASGTGLHIWGTGGLPFEGRNVRPCEIYASGRFMIVTGRWLQPTPLELRPIEERRVANIVRRFFSGGPARMTPEEAKAMGTITGQEVGPMELEELEALAETRLLPELFLKMSLEPGGWRYAERYGKDFPSQSEADFWFMSELAWATRGDPDRMDRLFRASALMRQKYLDKRGALTYGHRLVQRALSMYHERQKEWKARRDAEAKAAGKPGGRPSRSTEAGDP